jgi:hypothetical protein
MTPGQNLYAKSLPDAVQVMFVRLDLRQGFQQAGIRAADGTFCFDFYRLFLGCR